MTADQIAATNRLQKLRDRLSEWQAEKLSDRPAAEFADLFIGLIQAEIAKEEFKYA